jgi:hypothetical protein
MEAAAAALEGAGGAQELARLRAKSEPITPRECDVIEAGQFFRGGCRPGPDDPPKPSTAVIDVKPNPPAAPAPPAYDYNRNQDWKGFINSDGSIRSTPRGRWNP